MKVSPLQSSIWHLILQSDQRKMFEISSLLCVGVILAKAGSVHPFLLAVPLVEQSVLSVARKTHPQKCPYSTGSYQDYKQPCIAKKMMPQELLGQRSDTCPCENGSGETTDY